jgi:hypothetical protein
LVDATHRPLFPWVRPAIVKDKWARTGERNLAPGGFRTSDRSAREAYKLVGNTGAPVAHLNPRFQNHTHFANLHGSSCCSEKSHEIRTCTNHLKSSGNYAYRQKPIILSTCELLRAGRSGNRIPLRGEIFRTHPDRPRGPPSLLYNGYRILPGGRGESGRGVALTTHPIQR